MLARTAQLLRTPLATTPAFRSYHLLHPSRVPPPLQAHHALPAAREQEVLALLRSLGVTSGQPCMEKKSTFQVRSRAGGKVGRDEPAK